MMTPYQLIREVKQRGGEFSIDGDYLDIEPVDCLTDDLLLRLKANKRQVMKALKMSESRRQKVLTMLAENPSSQRAIVTDLESDPDNVILTIAIRDQYTLEMLISKKKYDTFLLLEVIEKAQIQ